MKKHDDVHAKSQDKFEDTNGVIRNRKSKDRQYNVKKKRDKQVHNGLQNTKQETTDQATRTS